MNRDLGDRRFIFINLDVHETRIHFSNQRIVHPIVSLEDTIGFDDGFGGFEKLRRSALIASNDPIFLEGHTGFGVAIDSVHAAGQQN